MLGRFTAVVGAGLVALAASASAQVIDQARGVDSRVDYRSLVRYGPWDDRNYDLTLEDLELLAENESELRPGVPAFYRVELRRAIPDMPRTGPAQYPRRALPQFFLDHGGYLVDGVLYRSAVDMGGKMQVDLDRPAMTEDEWRAAKAVEALLGDVRVTTPNGAAESAVAINPVSPDLVIAGSNGPGSGQKMHYSTDGGETWQESAPLPLGGTCCDPTVAWSSDGSLAYAATLGSGVMFYRSADGGQTWSDLQNEPGNDPRREFGLFWSDKEYLHADTHPASPCVDTLHMTWHENNVLKYSRSTDLGHTWSSAVSISSGSSQHGIGSDIVTDTSGRLYYFWPATSSRRIYVRRSDDCGATFGAPVVVASTEASYDFPLPSITTRRAWVHVATAADLSDGPHAGTVYAAWTDTVDPDVADPASNHARIQVAFSRDGGDSWTTVTPHDTSDATKVDRWHPWIAVGPDGTVHLVFYDTARFDFRDGVDLVWTRSTDGGQTWSSLERMTTAPSPKITSDSFEFGDYNGLDVQLDRLVAVFTDNRNESGGASDSIDIYAAGAELAPPPLFADGFESGDATAWSASAP